MTEQEQAYFRNLTDAGCTEQAAAQSLFLLKKGKKAEVLRLLAEHRSKLLDRLHDDQRQIDCLDYFIYQIQKKKIPEE